MRFAPAFFVPAALVLAHCSSPVPATPDAAWIVNLSSGGAACAINLSTVPFGDSNLNVSSIQKRVTDGELIKISQAGGQTGTAKVECAVSPVGTSFKVQARTSIGADSFSVTIEKIDKSATKDAPAIGTVVYLSDKTVSPYSGDCKFYFASGNEGVDTGKFWAAFTCDGLTYSSNPPSTCPILESYVAIESCQTVPLL